MFVGCDDVRKNMDDRSEKSPGPGTSAYAVAVLSVCLQVAAALVTGGGVIAGVAILVAAEPIGGGGASVLLWAMAPVVGGFAIGCGVWAMAVVLRSGQETLVLLARITTQLAGRSQLDQPAEPAAEKLPSTFKQSASKQLEDPIQAAADALHAERRSSLYGDIQRFAAARQWLDALTAANKLLEGYGDSDEAKVAALQMSTIENNAKIAEVRALRDRFCELVGRDRYGEALSIGREVIRRFPDTKAAEDLCGQLARLEELARHDKHK